MRTILLSILFLTACVFAVDLATGSDTKASYPVFLLFSPDGEVTLVIHQTPYQPGDWDKPWYDFKCQIYKFNQWMFFEFLGKNWLRGGFTLNTFNTLSKNWLAMPRTWEDMGLTTSEYLRWLKTGELIKDADYAARLAEEAIERLKETYGDITNLKFYINTADNIYHKTPDCVDCIDDIEIGVMSIFEMGMTRKQCTKCFVDEAQKAAEEKQVASAMAEISQIQYYINPGTGAWHSDPNCPDNVGTIAVSPLDILKYENRKPCGKCMK